MLDGWRLYDDYAHHPTEVAATLSMFKTHFNLPVTVIFQPHLFSRTLHFARQFAEALSLADRVYVTDIYGAREKPMDNVSSHLILQHLGNHPYVRHLPEWRNGASDIFGYAGPKGVLVTMGAGDITEMARGMLGTGSGH